MIKDKFEKIKKKFIIDDDDYDDFEQHIINEDESEDEVNEKIVEEEDKPTKEVTDKKEIKEDQDKKSVKEVIFEPITEDPTAKEPVEETVASSTKSVVISFILDTTYSMSKIYFWLYRILIKEIDNVETSNASILWRVSFITDVVSDKVKELSSSELKDLLKSEKLEFKNGSPSGYENIMEPLKNEVNALKNISADIKGLLLFSDSLPSAESSANKIDGCQVDFGCIYLYSNDEFQIKADNVDVYSMEDLIRGNLQINLDQKINKLLEKQ